MYSRGERRAKILLWYPGTVLACAPREAPAGRCRRYPERHTAGTGSSAEASRHPETLSDILSMVLYLIRHGIAEDRSITGSDADRQLTQRGTLRTAMVAKGLKKLDISFDRIISSPYVRARQTAEIIGRITGHKDDILLDKRLVPHAQFEEVSDLVLENNDAQAMLLVGHEPSMGLIISGLCAGGHLMVDVKKASVTAVELTRFRPYVAGHLLWSITPKLFEGLSR